MNAHKLPKAAQKARIIRCLALLSLGVLYGGCDSSPTELIDLGGPVSLHTWGNEGESNAGTVYHLGKRYAIWSDSPFGGGGSESNDGANVVFKGHLTMPNQGRLDFRGTLEPGLAGSVEIDGQRFDLVQGSLFLVKHEPNGCRIHQMKRDLTEVEFESEHLRKLAESDSEIQAFFSADSGLN